MTLWATIAVLIHVPAISVVVQQVLILTLGPNLSAGLFFRNMPVTCILMFAVLKRWQLESRALFNPTFVAWLSSMLLEIEWLTSRCHDDKIGWDRAYYFVLLVGHIAVTLWTCLHAAHRTLPIAERQTPAWHKLGPIEQRKTQPVYFVSSPAFGPIWLVQALYQAQDRVVFLAYRAGVWLFASARPLSSHLTEKDYEEAMEATRICLTTFTLLSVQFFIPTLWFLILVFSLATPGGLNRGFIWNILELVCHYALEIDGEYFELRRAGDSIKLSRTLVPKPKDISGFGSNDQEPERIILSRKYAGCTFMTKDEIAKKGEDLIATSPSYDAVKYNCQSLRNNLFNRILDDRAVPAQFKRLNLGWVFPHASLLQVMVEYVFSFCYNLDMSTTIVNMATSKTVWGAATAALPLLWIGFAVLKLINTVSGIVWCVSTFEGNRFRFRIALPQILATILILRALPVVTRNLSTLSPAQQVLYLLSIIRYSLTIAHYVYICLFRGGQYYDNSFAIISDSKLKPERFYFYTEVDYRDFAHDIFWERHISLCVSVRKVQPICCEEEKMTEALTYWCWQIEDWELQLFIICIIMLG